MKTIPNYIKYDFVFILFCVSNFLNIFIDRGSTGLTEETGSSRLVIQLINVVALSLMVLSIFSLKLPRLFLWVKWLIGILVLYFIVYLYFPKGPEYSLNHYVRFITNLVGFVFFYRAYNIIPTNLLTKYVQVYVLTLLISSAAKILSTSLFSLENLGAGDTASISLVFLISLIFVFYKSKYATLLYLVAFGFAVISLRRTCIIAFLVSIPFVFSTLKANIKLVHLIAIAVLSAIIGIYLWQLFGASLVYRFSEMTTGSGNTYGSGRSLFYVVLFDDFFKDPNYYFFGYGLNSVWHFYKLKHYYYLPHAHNDFLEILYTFGFLGTFIWISFLISLVREKWKKHVSSAKKKLYYMAILLYLIVGLASGTILRIEMLPFVMSISFLLAYKHKIDNENILLLQRAKYTNVLVAKNTLF